VRSIGSGGMGAVYEVERVADSHPLALKVLTRVADPAALARFAREAQTAAEIDHPNIVSVLDIDISRSGMLFLVMELVPGASLSAEREHYGEMEWALTMLRQIASALAAMHARGIIHRDLKPGNVLLNGKTVKIADFGLAALLDEAPLADTHLAVAGEDSPSLTRTGAIIGTPLYMAPELVDGAHVAGPSSDVFSFGVLAYELLANRLPFAAPPVFERLARRAVARAKPLAEVAPKLPAPLCGIIDRCLAEALEQRPTAREIAAVLEAQ
jgi:serine/threonine protein kinase